MIYRQGQESLKLMKHNKITLFMNDLIELGLSENSYLPEFLPKEISSSNFSS